MSIRDRIRTTNNMLGDCYAAAVVEQLSKKELMALDAAAYQVKITQIINYVINEIRKMFNVYSIIRSIYFRM